MTTTVIELEIPTPLLIPAEIVEDDRDLTQLRARGYINIETDIANLKVWSRALTKQIMDDVNHENDGLTVLLTERVGNLIDELSDRYFAALD